MRVKMHLTLAGDLVVFLLNPPPTLLPALCPGTLAFRDHVSDFACSRASSGSWPMGSSVRTGEDGG